MYSCNFSDCILTVFLQEYSVQITFREDWNDPRLTYDDFEGNQDHLI